MGKYRIVLSASILFVLFVIVFCPGCINAVPQEENLTAAGLADQYLLHADAIRNYRSEYSVSSGTAENPFSERIRYDYKAPSFARMEQTRSSSRVPGSFATTNGTGTAWYNAETRTYDLSSGMKLPQEYDYQAIVRRIIADRNFMITGRDTSHGPARYQIEVVTEPWSDKYTPYISSRIRAWVEPSTGLAWNVMTYYGCGSAPVPTTPPGFGAPNVCGVQERPNNEIRYESIAVNTGIPDSFFDFIPPEGSGPRCVPKFVNYVEPPRTDALVPIDQPLPGGVRFSLHESDSGRIISLKNGDIVEITLSTIPGLAYRWIMPAEGSGLTLLNAGPFYEMPEKTDDYYSGFMGGRGYYRWRYLAEGPGTETIDGIFSISGCDIQGARRFNLTVNVVGNG
jgi:predicted secreted protein/outer membrane lipoprotein-sorting protein